MNNRAQESSLETKTPKAVRLACLLTLVATSAWLYLAGCSPRPAATPPPAPQTVAQASEPTFVGNEACAPCHPDIVRDHNTTGHAHTMRLVNRKELKDQMPPTGKTGAFNYEIKEREGMLWLTMKNAVKSALPLTFAFGAGKHALTFLCPWENDQVVELRMSYHPPLKEWFVTPGQVDPREGAELGVVWDKPIARRCLSCHTTMQPLSKNVPDEKFYGVGCESCHGPSSQHVEAKFKGAASPASYAKLNTVGGAAINNLCGRCHRTAKDLSKQERVYTQRFQPYGLSISKCFLNSGDKLTCVTCHNPHKNADTNAANYNAICKNCHTPGKTPPFAISKTVACRLNKQDDCTRCHMPMRPLRKKQGNVAIEMADHYIRSHKDFRQ